ncbi:hypothetical protein GCM10007362_50850 [Saccharibacillus endophyticus]|uniref:Uncharacterized protein n=1 Tax=Saccharibacillus endophyticus TaxID=2060666 RepID=A0ABQ2A8L5_9BACL|nr:hypothetical protein GCM10007362_50850 [Saccharibacillus endophyticus]
MARRNVTSILETQSDKLNQEAITRYGLKIANMSVLTDMRSFS